MLALVFQVFKPIELNMVEEKVVTLGFSKETLKPSPTSLTPRSRGHTSRITPQKGKGPKHELDGGSSSYTAKYGGKEKCWRCGGPH
jgi:hypothetical protein